MIFIRSAKISEHMKYYYLDTRVFSVIILVYDKKPVVVDSIIVLCENKNKSLPI